MISACLVGAWSGQGAGVPAPAQPGVNIPWVKVDTVGYPSAWKKVAVVNAAPKAVRALDAQGQVAWTAAPQDIVPMGKDESSGDDCWQVDLSALKTAGTYTLALEPAQPLSGQVKWLHSAPFTVGDGVYAQALVAAQKMFYYQRTRTALKEPYTLWGPEDDDYTRATPSHVHPDVGWLLDTYPRKVKKLQMVKGWHDAGNFDMYIPSTAVAVETLLWAYELRPQVFGDANGIPESGNKIPDILDEATWGLDWMLPLQEADGSFRAREAVMKLGEAPEGPADHDKSVRWVSGIGSASTAKACAALAQAARVFKPFDEARSRAYAAAAQKAWAWLEKHPDKVFLDVKDSDQPLWDDGHQYPQEAGCRSAAAAEMWHSFQTPGSLERLKGLWSDGQLSPDGLSGSWVNTGRFAVYTMALDSASPADLRAEARQRIAEAVRPWRGQVERGDGYRCALKPADYYWGTPSNLMQRVQLLCLAARLDPQDAWALQAARDQWHWVLGRNPNACSLVTRVGQGPARIYHSEWGQKKVPPPGFLVDGPNGSEAKFLAPGTPAKALLWDNPTPLLGSHLPAHALWHNSQSDLWEGGFIPRDSWDVGWWVVTEVDIQYNADLVWAAAQMQD